MDDVKVNFMKLNLSKDYIFLSDSPHCSYSSVQELVSRNHINYLYLQEIGKALLPPTVTSSSKALPAATESSPSSTLPIAESVPQVTDNAPSKAEAVVEPTPEINSVPKAEENEAESVPGIPRPLSPYPNVKLLIYTFLLISHPKFSDS